MLRNVASQKWRVYAWDTSTGAAKTGDAANISAHIRKDDAASAATNDAAPTEASSTNEPGYYDFDLTQSETDAAKLSLAPKSSTSNIAVIACPPVVYTRPQYFSLLGIASDGDLTKVNTLDGHTAQTGDSFARIGANGSGLTSVGLADGAITAAKLASDAITTAKIADGAFTAAKFASGAFDAVWSVSARTLTSISGLGIALASKLTKYVQLLARKDAAIATDNATELTEINANGGSGGGTYANTTDAQEAIRDRGDAAYLTATGFSTHSAADVWAVGTRTLTAFGFSVTVGTNNDKTGYTLTTADKQALIELFFTFDATATYASADAGSLVKQIADNAGGSALTEAGIAAAVWSAGTRVLTAGTNIVLAKGTGITGFTDIDASGIRTAVGLASPNIDSQLSAINSKTTNLPAAPAATGDIPTVSQIWTTALTEAYAAKGAAGTAAQLLYMILQNQTEVSAAGTTMTVKKLDGSTTAMTFTLNDDSAPTSITRAT